jgi:hypothetical protein
MHRCLSFIFSHLSPFVHFYLFGRQIAKPGGDSDVQPSNGPINVTHVTNNIIISNNTLTSNTSNTHNQNTVNNNNSDDKGVVVGMAENKPHVTAMIRSSEESDDEDVDEDLDEIADVEEEEEEEQVEEEDEDEEEEEEYETLMASTNDKDLKARVTVDVIMRMQHNNLINVFIKFVDFGGQWPKKKVLAAFLAKFDVHPPPTGATRADLVVLVVDVLGENS